MRSTFSKEKVLHAKKREALGALCFTILSGKHFIYSFSKEKVLHAMKREALGALCFTILSGKHLSIVFLKKEGFTL